MRSRQKSNPTHQQISWHLGIINAVHVLLLCFLSSNVVDPEKSLHISDASSNSSHLRKICCLPGRRDMGNRQIRHEQLPGATNSCQALLVSFCSVISHRWSHKTPGFFWLACGTCECDDPNTFPTESAAIVPRCTTFFSGPFFGEPHTSHKAPLQRSPLRRGDVPQARRWIEYYTID